MALSRAVTDITDEWDGVALPVLLDQVRERADRFNESLSSNKPNTRKDDDMKFKVPNFQEWYFTHTAEGRAVVERANIEYVARRQAIVDELARMEAAHEKNIETLLKEQQKAAAALKKTEDAYRAACTVFQRAKVACSSANNVYESDKRRLERKLRDDAPPEILQFHKHLRDCEYQVLRNTVGSIGAARLAEANAAMAAIRRAREAAEKLEVSAVENVEMALAEIEAGIPPLN